MSELPVPVERAADPSSDRNDDVGRRVKSLRKQKAISARQLAERASLTAAYISRLENGKLSPTVATLSRIMQAMGESISALFDAEDDEGPVVRRGARTPLRSRGVEDRRLTPPSATRLEVLETFVEPNQTSGDQLHTHPGDEECVIVLEGSLLLRFDEAEHLLQEGDAATFACRRPHQWLNPSSSRSRLFWIFTPAVY